jgi:ATP-binding cassette subfamily B multidrug efflux pump
MMFIGNLNYVVIAVIGGLRVASGAMSIGDVQAFIQYSRQFTMPLTQLASMINVLQSGIASAERVFELLDAEEQSPDPARALADAVRGRVEFDTCLLLRPGQAAHQDLSLVAEPGQTVAIVGPTGAGKTTLVNLLMRFYELDGGRSPRRAPTSPDAPRRAALQHRHGAAGHLAVRGTIRDNIAYGNLDATEEQILEAAKATYVDRFVHSLPDGYDTVIDDEGGNLSAPARSSCSPSPGRSWPTRRSSSSTRRPARSTPAPRCSSSRRWRAAVEPHELRDRPPAVHHPRRRHHPGDGGGRIVEQGNHHELLAADGAYAASTTPSSRPNAVLLKKPTAVQPFDDRCAERNGRRRHRNPHTPQRSGMALSSAMPGQARSSGAERPTRAPSRQGTSRTTRTTSLPS